MNILPELKDRFRTALETQSTDSLDLDSLLEMIRPAQNAQFGDYQANMAMPLGKKTGQAPREVADKIVASLAVDDLCHPPTVAGPGFINPVSYTHLTLPTILLV